MSAQLLFFPGCRPAEAVSARPFTPKDRYMTDRERKALSDWQEREWTRIQEDKSRPCLPADFAPAFPLPAHAGVISQRTADYYLELARRYGRPKPYRGRYALELGSACFTFDDPVGWWWSDNLLSSFESIDRTTGIKRGYVVLGDRPWMLMYHADHFWTLFNVTKLRKGQFKSEHLPEVVAEIEVQLGYMAKDDRTCKPKKFPEPAVLMHFKAWCRANGYEATAERLEEQRQVKQG